jgi:hypothetical protein
MFSGILIAVGCRQGASLDLKRFINEHPNIVQCRQAATPSTIPLWGDGIIRVTHAARAIDACPGPGFPFVSAKVDGPYRWIQVVELNVPTPADAQDDHRRSLNGKRFPWVFVDMEERLRPMGRPFVNESTDGSFWDNPVWADLPPHDQADGIRRWRARSYLVAVADKTIRARGGFTWGWSWRVGDIHPNALDLIPLDEASWTQDKVLMDSAFPEWIFK